MTPATTAGAGQALEVHAIDLDLVEDHERRRVYHAACEGSLNRASSGSRIVFCVSTTDLDEGRGDLFVAVGLGLALHDLGYGVDFVARDAWHLIEEADVVVGLLPDFDPSLAPPGAATLAWVRNETERWASQSHLVAYDRVIASSELSLRSLRRVTPRADGVVPIGVDTRLFSEPARGASRLPTAATTAHFWGTVRDVHREFSDLAADADVVMYGHLRGEVPPDLLRWARPAVSYFALPDLYRRIQFVVDDLNATTLGYGSLNSRFFESAACGALPVVNGILGTRQLGLPDPPSYRQDLGRVLSDLRADVTTPKRAAELTELVRAEHSWDRRAEPFAEVLDQVCQEPRSPHRRALHFFPDFRAGNCYQKMLFEGLGSVGAYPMAVEDLSAHLIRRTSAHVDPGVLNLHWTSPILQSAHNVFEARRDLTAFEEQLTGFRERGGRLIWTVHNLYPHETRYPGLERELAQLLAGAADLIHVLAPSTAVEVVDHFHLPVDRIRVVEHSSYEGQYPSWVTPEAARRTLGLAPSEKVVLVLGGLRPYKGHGRVLDAFTRLSADDPTLRLVVAGRPSPAAGVSDLVERLEAEPRVLTRFGYVPDGRLQVYLRAADVLVLPYHRILNSGAFLLAETFGVPVVAPRDGALRGEEGQAHVRLFEPNDDASLEAVLRAALRDVVEDPRGAADARQSALTRTAQRSPEQMASAFAAAVSPLLG